MTDLGRGCAWREFVCLPFACSSLGAFGATWTRGNLRAGLIRRDELNFATMGLGFDAAEHLRSQGWAGEGTGLRTGARARPISAVKKRDSLSGLGKDSVATFPWWARRQIIDVD